MGTDAFQEVDIFGITLPIVKHSYVIRIIRTDIPAVFAEAFRIWRTSGRPGPVLIDLPKNVAAQGISPQTSNSELPPAVGLLSRTTAGDRRAPMP